MKPIEWLETHQPGFPLLTPEDREVILHFALLWSLFEFRALNTYANADAIVHLVRAWADKKLLNPGAFDPQLQYFRDRYFPGGQEAHHFGGLNLRKNDHPELVRAVLDGTSNDPVEKVAVLLIVVFRLRNNLFHGIKWDYGIQGQRENFEHANEGLMAALAHVMP